MKTDACPINKQRMLWPSSPRPLQLQLPLTAHPEGTEDGTAQDTGQRQLRALQRADFNEPRRLHLPTQRKALKSLTGDVCSLWLGVFFWYSTTCYFSWAKIHIHPGSSLLPLWSSSSDLSKRLSPRIQSSVMALNKTKLATYICCAFLFHST